MILGFTLNISVNLDIFSWSEIAGIVFLEGIIFTIYSRFFGVEILVKVC